MLYVPLVRLPSSAAAKVVDSVKRVSDIMAGITAASQEQSAGIEQVNQAISQMDQVTQQNATLVEQAAAASESMQDQAASLAHAVSVFKLGQDQANLSIPANPLPARGPRLGTPTSENKPRAVVNRTPGVKAPKRTPVVAVPADADWEEF